MVRERERNACKCSLFICISACVCSVHRQLRFATYILLCFMVVARLAAIVYTKTSRVNPNVHKQKCANITLQTANTDEKKNAEQQTLNKMLIINMKSQAI